MYPDDLHYTATHEWIKVGSGKTARVGITDHAAEQLGDIVYVSLPAIDDQVSAGSALVELESTKSVGEVFTELDGVITAVNSVLEDSPETINQDPYGDGWLFEIEFTNPEQLEGLLSADEYAEVVENEEG